MQQTASGQDSGFSFKDEASELQKEAVALVDCLPHGRWDGAMIKVWILVSKALVGILSVRLNQCELSVHFLTSLELPSLGTNLEVTKISSP